MVEEKIEKVEAQIEENEKQHKEAKSDEEKKELREEKKELREEKKELRKKEEQLREEKLLLMRRQQPEQGAPSCDVCVCVCAWAGVSALRPLVAALFSCPSAWLFFLRVSCCIQ